MNKTLEIAILGGGESGVGAAILAKREGFVPFVSDRGELKKKYKDVLLKYEIEWEEGAHNEARILSAIEVIKSPGIPDSAQLIQKLLKQGTSVISEIEFAARYCKAKTIGITGSNGKTTTALLTYHILQHAGLNVGLAGNVGQSFARQVAEKNVDIYVLELSSFQLDGIKNYRPDVSILLNITPDHLDRYNNSFEQYADSKMRIALNATPAQQLIYCIDDEAILKAISRNKPQANLIPFSIKKTLPEGAYIDNDQLIININNNRFNMSIHDLALQGKHNLYNSMASGIASRILDLRKEIIRESLSDFQNVEHRLETVATIHGIEFINDSKATNVNSTWYALESLKKPAIWIVGGVDKGNDYSELLELVKDKVSAIICLGLDNSKIIEAFKNDIQIIEEASSASEAVKKAYEIGRSGDVVLLSPACASFDLFENYEDRGHQFKKAVRAL
ncbi:MAG: UDP-N-acetylmuramoyl-L-alanine--D-glutamate ligase [Flavobacteriales bacterium]|nr:UDP-N-acetylmuramoyl-L-alanine--D-glutamate ligase [Flavobacteriales bacterium]